MSQPHPLSIGTQVAFDIAQGMAKGHGVVVAAEYDDGWLYQLDAPSSPAVDEHRHQDGELWVCDFEVRPVS